MCKIRTLALVQYEYSPSSKAYIFYYFALYLPIFHINHHFNLLYDIPASYTTANCF